MILDTTFVIDLMNKNASAVERANELVRMGEPQLISSPTVFELFSGLARSKKPREEKAKVMSAIKVQTILHLDSEAAEKAGEIDGTLIKEGRMIEPIDSMIAGIALVKREKVLTRNVKDFQKVHGLFVETY